MEVVVTRVQRPGLEQLPIRTELNTVSMTLNVVSQDERDDGPGRNTRAADVPIVVVKGRDGRRHLRGDDAFVAELIRRDVFGAEVAAALEEGRPWRSRH